MEVGARIGRFEEKIALQGAVPVAGAPVGRGRSPDDHKRLVGDWSRPLPMVK